MIEYSQEDADKVFRHTYTTLTAAIDFLVEMKVANPEGGKRFAGLDSEMIGLHTYTQGRLIRMVIGCLGFRMNLLDCRLRSMPNWNRPANGIS